MMHPDWAADCRAEVTAAYRKGEHAMIGQEYRYDDNHVGTITSYERFLDKDTEWHVALIVHLPTMPEGKQWLVTHGKEEDFVQETLQ